MVTCVVLDQGQIDKLQLVINCWANFPFRFTRPGLFQMVLIFIAILIGSIYLRLDLRRVLQAFLGIIRVILLLRLLLK